MICGEVLRGSTYHIRHIYCRHCRLNIDTVGFSFFLPGELDCLGFSWYFYECCKTKTYSFLSQRVSCCRSHVSRVLCEKPWWLS